MIWISVCMKIKREVIKAYLETENLKASEAYIYYAHGGTKLTEKDYKDYCKTWLHNNQVTIYTSVPRTLSFNFPNLGIQLLKIILKINY